MGADYIERSPGTTEGTVGNEERATLHLRGTKYTLISDRDAPLHWYVKEDPTIRLTTTETSDYVVWTITLPDGTVYTFKGSVTGQSSANPVYFADSRYPIAYIWGGENNTNCVNGNDLKWQVLPVSNIADRAGNVINYTWVAQTSAMTGTHLSSLPDHDSRLGKHGCGFVRTVRPSRITYNQGEVMVDFQYARDKLDRPFYYSGWTDKYPEWYFFPIDRLTNVVVRARDGSGVEQRVRAYRLGQENTGGPMQLLSISEVVTGSLNLTTNLGYAISREHQPNNPDSQNLYSLVSVSNPYGGVVTYTIDASSTDWPPAVKYRREIDDVTGTSGTWEYHGVGYSHGFGGYSDVQVEHPDGTCEWHHLQQFVDDPRTPDVDYNLRWRESSSGVYSECNFVQIQPDTADEVSRTDTMWEVYANNLPLPGNWDHAEIDDDLESKDRPRFVAVAAVETYLNRVPMLRTEYTYDVNYQFSPTGSGVVAGARQFGNVTRVEEHEGTGDAGASGEDAFSEAPLRTRVSTYRPNGAEWIINKPALTQVYSGTDTLYSQQTFFYDQAGPSYNWEAAPSAGLLTRQLQQGVLMGEVTGELTSQLVATRYGYEDGNLVWEEDALGRRSTYTYDSRYQAFVVCTKNALAQTVRSVYWGVPGVTGVTDCGAGNGTADYSKFGVRGRDNWARTARLRPG